MITLATFYLAALNYCEGSLSQTMCARHVANECVIEQMINPGHEADYYLEGAVEALPSEWWPE